MQFKVSYFSHTTKFPFRDIHIIIHHFFSYSYRQGLGFLTSQSDYVSHLHLAFNLHLYYHISSPNSPIFILHNLHLIHLTLVLLLIHSLHNSYLEHQLPKSITTLPICTTLLPSSFFSMVRPHSQDTPPSHMLTHNSHE